MNPKTIDCRHGQSPEKTTSRKLLPAILIGAAGGFLLCLGLLAWLVYTFFFGAAPIVYEGAEHYGKCRENRIHSGLLLFPGFLPTCLRCHQWKQHLGICPAVGRKPYHPLYFYRILPLGRHSVQ